VSLTLQRPAARASSARDMLVTIDAALPGTRDAVRALIPPASLRVIDDAAGSSWLDVEHHHWLVDGTLEVLGVEQAVASWRAGMTAVFQRPLHKAYVSAAVRLFFGQPGRVIALIPRGWPLAYRNFCAPTFQRTGDREAEVRFDDVAPEAFASPGYLHSWRAICHGIFDLERPIDGRTALTVDEARRSASIR
jgi:hypothetical protein